MQPVFREQKRKPYFLRTNMLDYPPHIHEDIELVYVIHGGGTVHCDGVGYRLQPGDLFIAFPQQVHHYTGWDPTGEYILLVVKPARLQHYGSIFVDGLPRQAVCSAVEPGVPRLLEAALADYERHGDSGVMDGYLTALFGTLLRCCPVDTTRPAGDCLSEVLTYCGQHFRESLTVERVAKALHISRSHISHTFRSRLGMSFCDYLHALRLDEAERLLTQERCSVTQVAMQAGFASLRTFNRVFRQHYGVSPTHYRQQRG